MSLSNRLPILAEDVKRAHSGVLDAAKTAAERAIDAGNALIEAKQLVKHGQWLPWLKEHCGLPERTAQLYMQIAKSGLKPAIVADIGLRAASKTIGTITSENYNPFAHCGEEGERRWKLFIMREVELGASIDRVAPHVEWLLQRQFPTPEEWFGEEGDSYREPYGMPGFPEAYRAAWQKYAEAHADLTSEAIEAKLMGAA